MNIPFLKREYFTDDVWETVLHHYKPNMSRDTFVRIVRNCIKTADDKVLMRYMQMHHNDPKYKEWEYIVFHRACYFFILCMMDEPY